MTSLLKAFNVAIFFHCVETLPSNFMPISIFASGIVISFIFMGFFVRNSDYNKIKFGYSSVSETSIPGHKM